MLSLVGWSTAVLLASIAGSSAVGSKIVYDTYYSFSITPSLTFQVTPDALSSAGYLPDQSLPNI
jgi:hypothetical protein